MSNYRNLDDAESMIGGKNEYVEQYNRLLEKISYKDNIKKIVGLMGAPFDDKIDCIAVTYPENDDKHPICFECSDTAEKLEYGCGCHYDISDDIFNEIDFVKLCNCERNHPTDVVEKTKKLFNKFCFRAEVFSAIDPETGEVKDQHEIHFVNSGLVSKCSYDADVHDVKVKHLLQDKYRQYGFVDVFCKVTLHRVFLIKGVKHYDLPHTEIDENLMIQLSTNKEQKDSELIKKMNYTVESSKRCKLFGMAKTDFGVLVSAKKIPKHMRDFMNITLDEIEEICDQVA